MRVGNCRPDQGRSEKLKRGGETEWGQILRKANSFCEILYKVYQIGGGGEGPSPPLFCTPMNLIPAPPMPNPPQALLLHKICLS